MYLKNDENFIEMMSGGYGRFDMHDMWMLMAHLNELHVNTIYVQQLIDGTFICTVDKPTVEYYLKERNQI